MEKTIFVVLTLTLLASTISAQTAKFCVAGTKDQAQCVAWNAANKNITCVNAASAKECYEKINKKEADMGIFDGGEIYDAGKAYNLVALYYEHRAGAPDAYTNYFAVAVVKSTSNLTLGTLKGAKSCHTGYGKTSGWKIPIGYFLSNGYMSWVGCDQAASAAAYFSQSCVPEVNSNEDKLCALCNGTSSTKCTKSDPYAGYNGAFNCLKNGAGDVAFIKESIVSKISSGYKLLCPDNTTKVTTEFKTCNLAAAPAHAILVRKGDTKIPTYKKILEVSNTYLKPIIFNGNGIFSNGTEIKVVADNRQDYDKYLNAEYMKDVKKLESCTNPSNARIYSGTPVLVITSVFMVSLAKLMI